MEAKHLIGVFDSEESLMAAFRKMKDEGIEIKDVFTPYPIHEIMEKHGRKSRMTWVGWFYGLIASLAVLAFLFYTAVLDWPLNYGGKPSNAFPSFIVITIILTIFSITILSLGTFSWRANLWPSLEKPIWHEGATDDKFVILVDREKEGADRAGRVMKENGAIELIEK
jgi:Alternative complex III, ActD subunit